MKRSNKKGFTIVELVIVIAVVAILAAVLIPTFAGIVKKANLSADQRAVRDMNTALAIEGELEDIDDVIDALAEAGFNSKKNLVPVSAEHGYFWYEGTGIVLVKGETVVFPEGVAYDANGVSLEASVQYIDVTTDKVDTLTDAFANGNKEITLSGNVAVGPANALEAPAGSDIVFDLNGKTIDAGMTDATKHVNVLHVKGKVTLKNGTINTRNIMVYDGGELIIEDGVTINALDSDGGAALWIYEGGKVTVNGGTITSGSFTYAIKNHGELTINNVTLTADRGGVAADAGTVTIKGGKFTVTGEHAEAAHVVYAYDGTVVITGGEFINNGSAAEYHVDTDGSGSITLADGTKLVAGQSK